MLGILLVNQNPFFACLKATGLTLADCLTTLCSLVLYGLIQEALVGKGNWYFFSCFCSFSLELVATLETCHYSLVGSPSFPGSQLFLHFGNISVLCSLGHMGGDSCCCYLMLNTITPVTLTYAFSCQDSEA